MKDKIVEIIADVMDVNEEDLEFDVPFQEGKNIIWDSIKALDIVAALEKEFKIRIDESNIPNMDTINKIVDVMGSLTGSKF